MSKFIPEQRVTACCDCPHFQIKEYRESPWCVLLQREINEEDDEWSTVLSDALVPWSQDVAKSCPLGDAPQQKKYRVKLDERHSASPTQIHQLGNMLYLGGVNAAQEYTRGVALKKARVFHGKIELVKI